MKKSAFLLILKSSPRRSRILPSAKRQEVQRIIARLSHQAQEWPDEAEMMRLRLRLSDSKN
jgi:hypothetical protein